MGSRGRQPARPPSNRDLAGGNGRLASAAQGLAGGAGEESVGRSGSGGGREERDGWALPAWGIRRKRRCRRRALTALLLQNIWVGRWTAGVGKPAGGLGLRSKYLVCWIPRRGLGCTAKRRWPPTSIWWRERETWREYLVGWTVGGP